MTSLMTLLFTSVHSSWESAEKIRAAKFSFSCMVSKFSIIISVFILFEVCLDSDLIYIGETGAK